jgi:hypothetical protein
MQVSDDRAKSAGISFGLAGLITGAALAGGQPVIALMAFVLIGGLGVVLAYSKSEWAAIQSERDERQRSINSEAVRFAYMAVLVVAVTGFVTELLHGDSGPFTMICAVGGFSHMAAVAYLKRRR